MAVLDGRVGRRSTPPLALGAAAVVAAVSLLPLVYVLQGTVETGWSESRELIFRPRIGELFANSALLCVGCVAVTVVLGTGLALLVERTDLPGRRVWTVLLVAPLAVPAFVNAYAWVSLRPGLNGAMGAVLVTSLSYFPFVFLPVASVLRTLDPTLEESALALGKPPRAVMWRLVLPQLRPAILGGALLVGLHTLAEFGALQMLRFPTFTTALLDQFHSTFNGSAATSLASVLVMCCLLLLTLEVLLRGRARYSRVGSGVARRRTPTRLRSARWPALAGVLLLCVLALGVPVYSVWHWLSFGSGLDMGEFSAAVSSTLVLAGGGAAATTVAALPLAWLAVRHRHGVTTVLERSAYVSSALPGVVIALALVTYATRYWFSVYQTTGMVVVAYVMLFLPRALVNLRAGIAQAPPELDDAARALGVGTARAMRRVTLPLIAPQVAAALAFVFLAASTELTATLLLAPNGTTTLATQFWAYSSEIDYVRAAPYAAAMIAISLPMVFVLLNESRRMRTQ
jgi:iron(III) transport system permease protein